MLPFPPGINVHSDYDFPRPSSRHPGGVNGYFGDGHGSFMSETMEYLVYQHIMTTWGRRAGQMAEMNPNPSAGYTNIRVNVFDPSKL